MSSTIDQIQGNIWINKQQQPFVGKGRIELLEKIAQLGSIAQAARAMHMSYKAAWDAIDAMNNLSPKPLVIRVSGGKGGGGSQVTDYGQQLIATFKAIETEHQHFLAHLSQRIDDINSFYQLIRIIQMSSSARNQFLGTISQIKTGPVNAEVILTLKGGEEIVATITQDSVNRLNLKSGAEAYALIKAPHVILMAMDSQLEVSARNRLCGQIVRIASGAVNAEITIELKGNNTLKAVVTQDAMSELGFKEGDAICGIFKASHVILAVKKQ